MNSPTPAIPGYRDFEMVAHGSTAFVYRAVQERLDRTVAVKVLLVDDDMTTADSIGKELEATVAVSNHPHIVSIIDTGSTEDGRPYIVMEYCDGGSYSAILKSEGPLGVEDVLDVGIKIGQALQAAHNANILHRDVKPQNILRAQYGPSLADFGIARAPASLAATEAIDKLTPLHASPEALLRQAQTASSDLFSLASSMWQMLAGFAPFANREGGTDPDEHRARVTSDEPPPKIPREDVPEWLEDLLVRALSRDPGRRPESCAALAEELQRGMYGSSGGVAKVRGPDKIGDISDEETVYRPELASRGTRRTPLDPFAPTGPVGPPQPPESAYTVGRGVTAGNTGDSYGTQLGQAVDPHYANQLGGSAPPGTAPQAPGRFGSAGAAPASTPVSSAPNSAPPQAPVSMQPPAPWAQQRAEPQAPQGPAFAPPVIGRDNEKRKPKAPKAPPSTKPGGGLKPYVVLGLVVTAVLAVVVVGWLWLFTPDDPGDLDQARTDGEGAPENVRIVSWLDGEITLEWDPPADVDESSSQLQYFVMSQRVGDDQASMLGSETTDTEFSASGLIPAEDYCFQVAALWEASRTPMSEPVCTDDEN
ncbi:protein kinase domain-containing protein [Glycomyces xiaoerkulensis]|uniref:protein kinase domain-containing protein n=1 Tax=Glycomyces xiaoerkulensis TaxID=2038139 RepID=UPI000C26A260|nr:protein kinase [Glycomyces xiaoerkulensis]